MDGRPKWLKKGLSYSGGQQEQVAPADVAKKNFKNNFEG